MSDGDNQIRMFGSSVRAFLEGFLGVRTEVDRETPARDTKTQIAPFPKAGIDGFLSHFILTLSFRGGERKGELISLTLPSAVQTVARTAPFVYRGGQREYVEFAIPEGSDLPRGIREQDFLITPPRFFEANRETVWLQILNLDARADTQIGPVRIILGETFRREYPDLFQPSFGGAQSLVGGGFPARLFFSPNAIIETPFGAFKTRPKALLGAEVREFPPVGSYPSLLEPVELDSVESLRAVARGDASALEEAQVTINALAHPIDAVLLGGEVFERVESSIARRG